MAFGTIRAVARTLFPPRILQWLGPIGVLGAIAVVVAAVMMLGGFVDVGANEPKGEGFARIVHATFLRATDRQSRDLVLPDDLHSPVRIARGAAHYGHVCARCHGAPGLGQNPIVLSMAPRPQYLPDVAGSLSDRQLFWIVKHGAAFGAMPHWPSQRRDDEVWSMVAFLRTLPRLGPGPYRRLTLGEAERGNYPRLPFGPPPPLRPYRLYGADAPALDSYGYKRPAGGFDDFAQTGEVLPMCARCHGADGAGGGRGAFPNLTGQSATYLRDTLVAYASGRRESGFMQTIATQLSPQQIAAVARHFASLPRRAAAGAPPADPALIALGTRIAERGRAGRAAACESCHGVTPAAAKAYPRLAGQSAWYLRDRMRLFRAPGLADYPGDPMPAIAHRLGDHEINAVAMYYALPPTG